MIFGFGEWQAPLVQGIKPDLFSMEGGPRFGLSRQIVFELDDVDRIRPAGIEVFAHMAADHPVAPCDQDT